MINELDLADAVARRVIELLGRRQAVPSWLTANEVAQVLAVDPAYVYENAARLGGRRLGDGPKARLRFRLEDVEAALPCVASRGAEKLATGTVKPKRRLHHAARLGTEAPLLPIRGIRGEP